MGASPLAAKSVILRTGPARIVLSAVAAAACLSNMALPQDDFADLDIETLDREAEKETVGREDDRAPQLLIAQAETQARNGQFMDAITSYRTFLKRHLTHRKSAEATKRIAELEAKVALKKREAELRGAIEKLAADPARQTAAWLALGDFYVEHKQYADVVGLCREMVSAKVLTPNRSKRRPAWPRCSKKRTSPKRPSKHTRPRSSLIPTSGETITRACSLLARTPRRLGFGWMAQIPVSSISGRFWRRSPRSTSDWAIEPAPLPPGRV